jgi:hypothetical protein
VDAALKSSSLNTPASCRSAEIEITNHEIMLWLREGVVKTVAGFQDYIQKWGDQITT